MAVAKKATPKFNNKKTVIDGVTFDSKGEAGRYQELKLLQRVGKIHSLRLQPEFILQDKFKVGKKTIRAIKYIADFEYIDTATECKIVEDFKGFKTKEFAIKEKMFRYKYPDLELKIVK